MGCNAIACYAASTDNEFLGNEISYPGGGGITLNSMATNHYEGPCASVCERNVVAGNHIHHCGQIFKHGAGVYINSASYSRVVNNTIHDTARHPIIATYACAGNVISFNELQNSNLETGDTGAIHTYQTNSHPAGGNVIENNLIGDVVGRATTVDGKFLSPHYTWGIYLDGESWKTTVRNNVVYRNTGGGVMMNSGRDNLWENNIFVDARDKQIQYSNYSKTGTGNRLFRSIFVYHNPKTQTGLEGQPGPEFLNTDYNLWWCPAASVPLKAFQDAGREKHSLVADPLFVDAAHDDYRLRPESPAFSLGFKPIDLSKVGLRGYPGPRAWPDNLPGKR
jgi:parallel beta-helix repeat protein